MDLRGLGLGQFVQPGAQRDEVVDREVEEDVFALLRAQRVALCIADAEDDLEVPLVATAAWGYLRLRRPDYSAAALKTWVQRLRRQDWRDAFVFFKHEDEGKGPKLAETFLKLAG